ncbi:MAG: hypothetical protein ACRDMX_06770 [Solirubrobacteraceae bacterium]
MSGAKLSRPRFLGGVIEDLSPGPVEEEAHRDPCVVPYLYVHRAEEEFDYPSVRAGRDARRVAWRYLECVLVQAASLRLRDVNWDIVFVTNAADRRQEIGGYGMRLLDRIESYGVEIRHADYGHRSWARTTTFFASHYLFDAIAAVAEEDRLWLLTDVDCVWADPAQVFDAVRRLDTIGSVALVYPADWDVCGYTPASLGRLGARLIGRDVEINSWIGGELVAATGPQLRELVLASTALEAEAVAAGSPVNTEEHLLTLANATGRVPIASLNHVAGRIWTGPRHHAVNPSRPIELGLWHLPGEKGLSFRRAAKALLRGDEGLRRDLRDPVSAGPRFNVGGLPRSRRVADDAWIAAQRVRSLIRSWLRG